MSLLDSLDPAISEFVLGASVITPGSPSSPLASSCRFECSLFVSLLGSRLRRCCCSPAMQTGVYWLGRALRPAFSALEQDAVSAIIVGRQPKQSSRAPVDMHWSRRGMPFHQFSASSDPPFPPRSGPPC
jgi:hypothetical protein